MPSDTVLIKKMKASKHRLVFCDSREKQEALDSGLRFVPDHDKQIYPDVSQAVGAPQINDAISEEPIQSFLEVKPHFIKYPPCKTVKL